jgi:sucrose-6-phosphate hydrolase SacC (GH32 family)
LLLRNRLRKRLQIKGENESAYIIYFKEEKDMGERKFRKWVLLFLAILVVSQPFLMYPVSAETLSNASDSNYHEEIPAEGVEAVSMNPTTIEEEGAEEVVPEEEEALELTPKENETSENIPADYYHEPFRPQFHFSPEENWMNDPNGMVYLDGEYHLFYQHNPTDKIWGPMYWGHAISTDLVNWEHMPIALYPDENGFIWSGSAVVDENNTSGFGDGSEPPLVAIFSYELGNDNQTVGLAFSNDKGRTWEKYEGNPVIDMPEETKVTSGGEGVFRDPKVFWNEENKEWVFVIASGKQVDFYTSPNLKEWTKVSRFENPEVNGDLGIWECSELLKLPVETEKGIQEKWVLLTSVANGPTGGQGIGYFIGEFDGEKFIPDEEEIKWFDYGADIYAGVTWSNAPNDRPILLGWMSPPKYAGDTPTDPWRSAMTLPRELRLETTDAGIRLAQSPVNELESLRGENVSWTNETVESTNDLLSGVEGDTLEIIAEIDLVQTTANEVGFHIRKSDTEYTAIGYQVDKKEAYVDRRQSGIVDFHPDFAAKHTASLESNNETLKLHMFVDRSSVEVFVNDGEAVFTEQIFPDQTSKGLELFADNGTVHLKNLEVYQVNRAHFTPGYKNDFKRSYGNDPSEIDVKSLPTDIENPSFETGDLTGWITHGSAFNGVVSDETQFWGGPFHQESTYHVWGFAGADNNDRSDIRAGVMKSSLFKLAGNGTISFLVGGGQDENNLYVSLVRASTGEELFKTTGRNTEQYRRVSWNASEYIGEAMYIQVVDQHSGGFGHINVDDFQVLNSNEEVIPNDIENPGFETGDLSGWTVVEGTYDDDDVSSEVDYWHPEPINKAGEYHLWGKDDKTTKIKSSHFVLAGTGEINFLIGGGNDLENQYVALMSASDDEELMRQTNEWFDDSENYHRVTWDASEYIGEELYLIIVDNDDSGGWTHINVDDFNVLHHGPVSYWSFDEGTGTNALDEISGVEDHIDYVFNDAVDKPSSDPLWREGIAGSALLFDGYSTFIEREASEFTQTTDALTIEAWVAPRAYEWGSEGKKSIIVNQHDASKNEGFALGMGRHGSWSFEVGMNGEWIELWADEEKPLEKFTWSHIVATYNKEKSELTLYLNGEEAGTVKMPLHATITPSNEPLIIGKHNHPAIINGTFSANMFNGLMDEVKIHNASYSAEKVSEIYNEYMDTFENGEHPTPNLAMDRSRFDGDRHRPQYHFISPEHWMNEPHAPFYFNGKYHIFYQHNPQGPYWNHIHWGHAVSDDMIHWEDMPVALAPEGDSVTPDGVWSGDATFDKDGLPVLLFTAGDDSKVPNQMTGLARSTFAEDGDINLPTWEMNDEPITVQEENLHTDEGEVWYGQFRDPYVWQDGDTWYQLVGSGIRNGDKSVGGTALLYTSTDLENWTYEKPFFVGDYANYPETGQVWELPVFLPLKDKDGNDTGKHVLLVNPWFDDYSPHNVKYVWHWIGTWDKENLEFTPDHTEPRIFDKGEHFTGPSGFVDPDGRSILFSIAQGKRSEQAQHDAGWAHNAGLPLSLTLRENNELGIEPIKELQELRNQQVASFENKTIAKANDLLQDVKGDLLEVILEVDNHNASEFGIKVRRSENGEEETLISYDYENSMYSIDRNKSSLDPDVRKGIQGDIMDLDGESLKLHIYLDRSMVEAYANGNKSLTSRVYPTRSDALGLELWSENGEVTIKSMEVWELGSAYGETVPAYWPDAGQAPKSVDLPNHDFQTGDLTGWITEGNAFTDEHITDRYDWGWGGPFNQAHTDVDPNHYHYWGFHPEHEGDGATGVMKSQNFILGGNGQVDFLVAGGNIPDQLYVALVRASDDEYVMKATGHNSEKYRRVRFDASEYIGEELYVKVVDQATGDWGHINVDNVNVPVDPSTEFDLTGLEKQEIEMEEGKSANVLPNGKVIFKGRTMSIQLPVDFPKEQK